MNAQPITTAPKTDVPILVWTTSYGWRPAYWACGVQAWVSPVSCEVRYINDDVPTHWMPMPEPPSGHSLKTKETNL